MTDNLRAVAYYGGRETDITDGLRVVYDQLTSSMDWGSGFLEKEEVVATYRLGMACGFDLIHYQEEPCVRCGHNQSVHRKAYETFRAFGIVKGEFYCAHRASRWEANVPTECDCRGDFEGAWQRDLAAG